MDVEETLAACERALDAGGRVDLRALGFWRAVAAVKRDPELIARYADRIGAIDRRAFERAVRPTFPMALGTTILTLGAVAGLVLIAAAFVVPQWSWLLLLAGAAVLIGATHDLAHLVVGALAGIRFTHWYLDGPTRLQPGLKIDYASYLRTPPLARAWMHGSGALVTKIVPFVALLAGAFAGTPPWSQWILVVIGLLQIATDVLFSIRSSDWKRFAREMRVARSIR